MAHGSSHLPYLNGNQFQCPHCNVVAQQEWSDVLLTTGRVQHQPSSAFINSKLSPSQPLRLSCCYVCRKLTVWRESEIVWPSLNQIAPPSPDMPDDVRSVYDEARSVYNLSPKSAAALLRLGIQHLCIDLGQPGENLNDDIGALVDKGLPTKVQQALDVVRVVGNNAVHPGQIVIDDNPQIVEALFKLITLIVETMITQPREVQSLYDTLPSGAKQQIQKRDA